MKPGEDIEQAMLDYYSKHLHVAATNRRAELDYLRHTVESLFPFILPIHSMKCKWVNCNCGCLMSVRLYWHISKNWLFWWLKFLFLAFQFQRCDFAGKALFAELFTLFNKNEKCWTWSRELKCTDKNWWCDSCKIFSNIPTGFFKGFFVKSQQLVVHLNSITKYTPKQYTFTPPFVATIYEIY